MSFVFFSSEPSVVFTRHNLRQSTEIHNSACFTECKHSCSNQGNAALKQLLDFLHPRGILMMLDDDCHYCQKALEIKFLDAVERKAKVMKFTRHMLPVNFFTAASFFPSPLEVVTSGSTVVGVTFRSAFPSRTAARICADFWNSCGRNARKKM